MSPSRERHTNAKQPRHVGHEEEGQSGNANLHVSRLVQSGHFKVKLEEGTVVRVDHLSVDEDLISRLRGCLCRVVVLIGLLILKLEWIWLIVLLLNRVLNVVLVFGVQDLWPVGMSGTSILDVDVIQSDVGPHGSKSLDELDAKSTDVEVEEDLLGNDNAVLRGSAVLLQGDENTVKLDLGEDLHVVGIASDPGGHLVLTDVHLLEELLLLLVVPFEFVDLLDSGAGGGALLAGGGAGAESEPSTALCRLGLLGLLFQFLLGHLSE